jgi:hypothetical protein
MYVLEERVYYYAVGAFGLACFFFVDEDAIGSEAGSFLSGEIPTHIDYSK